MSRIARTLTMLIAVLSIGYSLRALAETHLDADTIKAGLRTTTVEEEGFVDRALLKVDDGTIPESMVQSTFLWARKKSAHKFQYFRRGLIERAAAIGVTLE